ncbi:MAG: phosphonate ABC transporter, permease protein PhnE [Eubacteriales bacterium]|nr:phosphonate ABC transporter, permease protein PhnE [Eubacteriales bacterium]
MSNSEHISREIQAAYEKEPKRFAVNLGIALVIVALLAWSSSTVEIAASGLDGMKIAIGILNGIFHPDTELLFNPTTQGVGYLLLETVCIAFLGTIVGAVLAVPLAFLSATNIVPKPVAVLFRVFIMAIRTIPAFVYGLMFIRVTGPGAFAGLLTMSLCSIGMLCKMYVEYIEDMDTRILESLDASGCNLFQKIRYGILPQLFPDFVSTIIYRFDINLRDATVLGLVGAGGIGAPLIFAMNSYRWNEVGAILCGLIVLILIIEVISTKIRTKLARG